MHDRYGLRKFVLIGPWNKQYYCGTDNADWERLGDSIAWAKRQLADRDVEIGWWIVPTISDCTGYLTVNSSQETDTPYTQYPIIEVKRLTTEFTMKDGATAVIGGLSKSAEEDVDSGIPYLRKIPYVGQKLFGWKSRQKVQKEILVFVTVGIANPSELPKDVGLPKNAILGREYVRGNLFEPGDRDGSAPTILKLDMTNVDERQARKSSAQNAESDTNRGQVTITPVNDTPRVSQEAAQTPAPKPVEKAAEPDEPVATPIEPVADTPATEIDYLAELAKEAKEE